MKPLNPRRPWLLLYIVVNIIGACIILENGALMGDVSGNPLYSESALFFATTLIVISYALILGPTFSVLSKIRIRNINFGSDDLNIGKRIGRVLIFFQIAFMLFNLVTGVNIAGSNSVKTDNVFSMIWVWIPVDMLFFVYYGVYRENKYFYPNAVIWMISNLLRGWSSIFLIILFFEWCRAVRNQKITVGRTIIIGSICLTLYPILTNLKFMLRIMGGADITAATIFSELVDSFSGQNFFVIINDGLTHLIGRLQLTSLVVEVMRLSSLLQTEFANGSFAPFWLEGIHGIAYERIFSAEKSMPIEVAFTQYGDFNWQSNVGNWNTNIGYVGWFFIAPYLIPVYVVYTLFLGFLSVFLLRKIGISEASKDMLWLAWLIFLMPAWLGTFVAFIYALFVFLIIKIVAASSLFRTSYSRR